MAIDLITLALARKYTKDAVNGLGAIKGAPCTVDSVIDNGVSNVITLKWTGVDGADQTSVVEIQHGIGIANIQIDDDGSLICE